MFGFFKKIRLINKLLKLYEAVDNFYCGNKENIEKVKDFLPEIKQYIDDAERIIKRFK